MLKPILLLLLAVAEPIAVPRPPIATVTVTPDTVELTDAGRLVFEPDPNGFPSDPSSRPVSASNTLRMTSFAVRLWVDPTGKPVACEGDRALLGALGQAGCAQLMARARFARQPGMASAYRRGFVTVYFSVHEPVGGRREVFAYPVPASVNTAIVYPPEDTPDDQRLMAADGTLSLPIQPDDYPPVAMRYGYESRSAILLGIDRAGRVRTCRPVTNGTLPNTAALDNLSCVLALRRGKFVFAPDAAEFGGLRYKRTTRGSCRASASTPRPEMPPAKSAGSTSRIAAHLA